MIVLTISLEFRYRLTADTTWQDKGWKMWQSVDKATRTEFGFSAINGGNKLIDKV